MIGAARKFALAMLLAASAGSAHAEQEALGRLFFTPQERAEFDRQRESGRDRGKSPPEDSATYTINGTIRRQDGRHITWVNGQAVDGIVRVPGSRQPLRAGETAAGGERTDLLNGGRIIIHRPEAR